MKGTRVRVRQELYGSSTDHVYSINDEYMPQMGGKIFHVDLTPDQLKELNRDNYDDAVYIYSEEAGQDFMFHPDDITILPYGKPVPLPKPASFNPDKLFI